MLRNESRRDAVKIFQMERVTALRKGNKICPLRSDEIREQCEVQNINHRKKHVAIVKMERSFDKNEHRQDIQDG